MAREFSRSRRVGQELQKEIALILQREIKENMEWKTFVSKSRGECFFILLFKRDSYALGNILV